MNHPPGTDAVTFIELEFDTLPNAGAPLGDIASSLVSLHDLLRDLASLAAYPATVEFREIQVVAIELRSPLKIRLSLRGISAEAVRAFQEICRDIIVFRERINKPLDVVFHPQVTSTQMTDKEAERLYGHIVTLQNAEVPLKRVVVVSDQ